MPEWQRVSTYDDEVHDEDSEIGDDDAELHWSTADLAIRGAHQVTVRLRSRRPWVAQQNSNGTLAQNPHNYDEEDAQGQAQHLHGGRECHDASPNDGGGQVEHSTRHRGLLVIIVNLFHKVLCLTGQKRRPLGLDVNHILRPCFLRCHCHSALASAFRGGLRKTIRGQIWTQYECSERERRNRRLCQLHYENVELLLSAHRARNLRMTQRYSKSNKHFAAVSIFSDEVVAEGLSRFHHCLQRAKCAWICNKLSEIDSSRNQRQAQPPPDDLRIGRRETTKVCCVGELCRSWRWWECGQEKCLRRLMNATQWLALSRRPVRVQMTLYHPISRFCVARSFCQC